MLRRVFAAFAIVCATGVILGFGAARSQHNRELRGTPSLRLDKTIERLAPAPPGTRVTARFRLYNDGTAPLRVHYLQSSCGCVQTELSRTEVPPGESAELQAEVLVIWVGRRESKIQFFTNSDAREPVTLTVIAQSEVALPYVIGERDCLIVFNEC